MEAFAVSYGFSRLVRTPTFFPVEVTPVPASPLGNSEYAIVEVKYPTHPDTTELAPTLFIMNINVLVLATNNPLHSFAMTAHSTLVFHLLV